jgi:thiosulfate/3-mercaptopyruvate sulfurtransferase
MAGWRGGVQFLRSTPVPGAFTAVLREELRATKEELQAGSYLVLDVREPDEFAGAVHYHEARGGHLPGAANAPWRSLLVQVPAFPDDKPVATYCTGGVRSGMAYTLLRDAGVPVAHYDGSWWEWARDVPGG